MFSQGCEIRIWQWCGFEPTISEWRANPYDYLYVHKYSKFRRTNQSFPIWKEIPPNWDFFPSSRVVKAFATLVNGPSFVRSFVRWLAAISPIRLCSPLAFECREREWNPSISFMCLSYLSYTSTYLFLSIFVFSLSTISLSFFLLHPRY